MLPAQAPLPTDCSFPFQPAIGSHTSMRISESLVGLSDAATRQNAGKFLNAALGFAPRPGVGSVNSPAPTGFAQRIVECGNASDVRLSQGAAKAIAEPAIIQPATT